MKSRFFVVLIVAAVLAGCTSKLVVIHVPNGAHDTDKVKRDGVFYALPKTVVRVGVKVDQTKAKATPFMKFAAIFAPGGQPVCENPQCEGIGEKEKYELQQGALFTTFGEPDPKHVYMVKFTGKGEIDQTVAMTWNDTGLISTASASVTNRTTDVVISGLRMAANIGTKAATAVVPSVKIAGVCPNQNSKNDPWIIAILKKAEPAQELVDNYCNMDKSDRDKFEKSVDAKPLELAKDAYTKRVAPLASAKLKLMSGDSKSMQPAELASRLDTLIVRRLTELYIGSTKKETWEGSLDIRTVEAGKEMPILHIDPAEGICIDQAELAPDSKPYPETFKILKGKKCQDAEAVDIVINYSPAEKNQLFWLVRDNTVKPSDERSFWYRIPAQVKAELKDKTKTYGVGVFSVAQMGIVVSLPAKRNSKMLSYELSFIEATGGLKSFNLSTTGTVDSETVAALDEVGGTIMEARKASREARKAAEDEVTVLTRKQTLLKLKDEICEIEKKYGVPCTVEPQ